MVFGFWLWHITHPSRYCGISRVPPGAKSEKKIKIDPKPFKNNRKYAETLSICSTHQLNQLVKFKRKWTFQLWVFWPQIFEDFRKIGLFQIWVASPGGANRPAGVKPVFREAGQVSKSRTTGLRVHLVRPKSRQRLQMTWGILRIFEEFLVLKTIKLIP